VSIVIAVVLYRLSRRRPVHAGNVNDVPPVRLASTPEAASA
jgi:hypothetical protein